MSDLYERVVFKPIPSPASSRPEIPEMLERVVMKSLERDLGKRYQSSGRMAYDLEYFLYKDGYGPTIVTLERHMRLLFPALYVNQPPNERIDTAMLQTTGEIRFDPELPAA